VNPLRSGLFGRLLLWFWLANVVTLAVSIFVAQATMRRAAGMQPDWQMLAQAADSAYIADGRAGLAHWSLAAERTERVNATLFENGRDLLDRPLPPALAHRLPQLLESDAIVLRPMADMFLAGELVTGSDGVPRRLVAWRGPRLPHDHLLSLLGVQLMLSLFAIGLVGWTVAGGISRPLAALQRAAKRMAEGDLAARVGDRYTRRHDELGLLAREFDRMAGRIEALVAHERAVLQDVSHELRSPLARLQLALELAQSDRRPDDTGPNGNAEHFARAEREIQRLDRLIGELLALSRMEADLPGMQRERVDLAALAADCVAAAQMDADALNATLALVPGSPAEVLGSPELLARAIDNLLSNALKFGAGGAVAISLERTSGRVIVGVRDHGPGVPEAELPRLFRPFFRGANGARADGHGLGLAIVKRIVTAHGGEATAANADGGGLLVRLSLPEAKSAAAA
jgi:signal transduction histidine kinase